MYMCNCIHFRCLTFVYLYWCLFLKVSFFLSKWSRLALIWGSYLYRLTHILPPSSQLPLEETYHRIINDFCNFSYKNVDIFPIQIIKTKNSENGKRIFTNKQKDIANQSYLSINVFVCVCVCVCAWVKWSLATSLRYTRAAKWRMDVCRLHNNKDRANLCRRRRIFVFLENACDKDTALDSFIFTIRLMVMYAIWR